ncbi:hypothetical protein DDT52_09320 [Brenneria roseae subsp. roseae]|nr:hypothetical protein DDT52_09320 [Brenneria roseae subsp. roseae]
MTSRSWKRCWRPNCSVQSKACPSVKNANAIRALSMDGMQKTKSGQPGAPRGRAVCVLPFFLSPALADGLMHLSSFCFLKFMQDTAY